MTRIEALRALEAKVVAGDRPWREAGDADFDNAALILKAFDGSLDAAKALHDAVLPKNWIVFSIDQDSAKRWYVTLSDVTGRAGTIPHTGHETNPARAWLLAIIRALIAQEEG